MTSFQSVDTVVHEERPRKIVKLKGHFNIDETKTGAGTVTMQPHRKTLLRHPQEIVYVVVGPTEQKFGMHKNYLCATSPYFKAMFEGKFQEADRGEVTLKDTSVSAFGMFNEWLYTGEIVEELCQEKDLKKSKLLNKDKPNFSQMLDVWILADYLLVPRLQNHIMDMMQARYKHQKIPPITHFSYFYENTQAGSPIRKFLVDLCVWRWYDRSERYRQCEEEIPPEMAMDLLVALARLLGKKDENPIYITGHYHVPVKE